MDITNFEILSLDSLTEVAKRLNSVVGDKMIILAGHCKAFFDGRIKSTLEDGDRFLVIKKDLSIIMHGPTGVKPLNWQKPQAGPIQFKTKEEMLEMFTRRTKTEETLTILFSNIKFLALWHAYDETELEIYGDESDLVKYLVSNPELIEPGFQVLKTEYNTDVGPVDIRGIGQEGETIVEVKKRKATPQDAHQLKRYIEFFHEKEKKKVKGILVAPDFPEKVLKYLADHKLISKVIKWEEIFPLIKRQKDSKLEEFFKEK
ncbi:MAG: endonuclease NucS domain-containing protein [Candidatus Heimdallarchaeaceae archaeon]|jgi:RecB family endonuclease NucS